MFYLLYNFLICLFIIIYLPILLLKIIFFSKSYHSFFPRLGFQKIPCFSKEDRVFWFHSISVGETKAIINFIKIIKKNEPQTKIVISTVTETGQNEAKLIEQVDATFYYPIDFYFFIKKIVKKIKPTHLFIVETDLWVNMLQLVKKQNAKIYLINGKISKNSQKNYFKFASFSKLLFEPFDYIFSQTSTYTQRFLDNGFPQEKISTVGNIKLDIKPLKTTLNEQKKLLHNFGLDNSKPIVIFGSTHKGEEELAIELFKQSDIQLILAPRHPERFRSISRLLIKEKISFNKFSEFNEKALEKKFFFLLDTLGQLMRMYEIADLAVVAGSFTPDIGGHNIFEPAFYKKPFIYGEYLYKQPGLKQLAQDNSVGIQTSAENLIKTVKTTLKDRSAMLELGEKAYQVIKNSKVVEKIYKHIII